MVAPKELEPNFSAIMSGFEEFFLKAARPDSAQFQPNRQT